MNRSEDDRTPLYAKYLGSLTRRFPNFDFTFIRPLRRKAARLLELKPGDRVIDAGCGSGGSFPFLIDEVGAIGEVVGIEISPETCMSARKRIAVNGWLNVRVIEGPAQAVELAGSYDALLMFAAPDVFASEEALNNLFTGLQRDGRLVIFGAKTSDHILGRLLNPLLRLAISRLSFPTTPQLEKRPWSVIESRLGEIQIEEHFFGSMFLAWGKVQSRQK